MRRWRKNILDRRKGCIKKPANKFTEEECQEFLNQLNSKEFADLSPRQIVPRLADQNIYLGSEATAYRILKKANMNTHRRKTQKPQFKKPEVLTAFGPNQIYSWDITYLPAARKGSFYYCYQVIDIFSRKIIINEVHLKESAEIAAAMIEKACHLENILPGQVHLHSDNGGPMKGLSMLAMLEKLGVTKSFSRPRVSDDNAFIESVFKTLKYHNKYPGHFNSLEEATLWMQDFTKWYNEEHYHSGIKFVTPAARHQKKDKEQLENRRKVYEDAKQKNPLRWSKNIKNFDYIDKVNLHPEKSKKTNSQ